MDPNISGRQRIIIPASELKTDSSSSSEEFTPIVNRVIPQKEVK